MPSLATLPPGSRSNNNCWIPSVTVWVERPGARIKGNHRSFQIGIMVKTATVAMAGLTSGNTSRKKIVYSESPSMRAAFSRRP